MKCAFMSGALAAFAWAGLFAGQADGQQVQSTEMFAAGVYDVAVTPDGALLVATVPSLGEVRIYRSSDGSLVTTVPGLPSATAVDSIVVTNTRAAVLGESALDILDLTSPTNPLIASHGVLATASGLTLTPDGSLVAVNAGGDWTPLADAGKKIFRMADGALVGRAPNECSGNRARTQAVVTTNDFAAFLSGRTDVNPDWSTVDSTQVTIFDLDGGPGGVASVVLETNPLNGSNLNGDPVDLTFTPDGSRLVVRSEEELAIYDLLQAVPSQVARFPVVFAPQHGNAVVASNTRAVCTGRNPAASPNSCQVDIVDLNTLSLQSFALPGWPEDLAVSPSGARAIVKTDRALHLLGLSVPVAQAVLDSFDHGNGGALRPLDGLALTDEHALAVTGGNHIGVWEHGSGQLRESFDYEGPTELLDLGITPDATKAVVVGLESVVVIDLDAGVLLDQSVPTLPITWFGNQQRPSDRLDLTNDVAIAGGYHSEPNLDWGWVALLDLTSLGANFCPLTPNSVGPGAAIGVAGSTSLTADVLQVWMEGAPPDVSAALLYGPGTQMSPFGNGFQCVGGAFLLNAGRTNAVGGLHYPFDLQNPPAPGGMITAGSTWHFQFLYRDTASPPSGFNLSNATTVTFVP